MSTTGAPSALARVRCYRACDRRYPFLWDNSDQPPGRWHDAGEGPCHYLATTAKGAWAEILRHEHITELEDLLDVELSLWEVDMPQPTEVPILDEDILTGNETSYAACRDEARRLRAEGAIGLRAPSAAVLSGQAERYGVDTTGAHEVGRSPTETMVVFGTPNALVGMPAAEGHPEPTILRDIRHL
jgi:RES domain-containing protein